MSAFQKSAKCGRHAYLEAATSSRGASVLGVFRWVPFCRRRGRLCHRRIKPRLRRPEEARSVSERFEGPFEVAVGLDGADRLGLEGPLAGRGPLLYRSETGVPSDTGYFLGVSAEFEEVLAADGGVGHFAGSRRQRASW